MLVHKMDLLEEDNGHPPGYKQERFEQKCAELKEIADEHNIKGVRFLMIRVIKYS